MFSLAICEARRFNDIFGNKKDGLTGLYQETQCWQE